MEEKVLQLALKVQEAGGRAMLVGGCVRDKLMGVEPKDMDVEVYGLTPEKLREVISEFGKVDAVGASFQVYKVGQDIDVSLPRRERKTGIGHKGFTVEGDPDMSFKEACSRRDFTVNAIMEDPLTGEIVDPFNGREAIKNKTLRMVSPHTFKEDSLRVLRLAQFASRFGFGVEAETAQFAKMADLSDLPKERVWMELEKMFLKSTNLEYGITVMENLGVMPKLFPSLSLYDKSAMRRVRHFAKELSDGEVLAVILAILCRNSTLTAIDELGVSSVNGYNVRRATEELLEFAQIPLLTDVPTKLNDYVQYKLATKVSMKLAECLFHSLGFTYADVFSQVIDRLGIRESPLKPLFRGRDLIEMGHAPSAWFGDVLDYVYDQQMRGNVVSIEDARREARLRIMLH